MTLTEHILVSLLTSGTVVAGLGFLVKRYTAKIIDVEFAKREAINHEHIKVLGQVLAAVGEQSVAALPELVRTANRMKQLAATFRTEDAPYKWSQEFHRLASTLTDGLLRHRLLLPEDLFEHFHTFKQASQDLIFEHNALTREDRIFDKKLAAERRPAIVRACDTIELSFEAIDKGARRVIPSMAALAPYAQPSR